SAVWFFSLSTQHFLLSTTQRMRHLQQQRRLPNPRLPADKHGRSRHDAAAEDAVELADAAGSARDIVFVDLMQCERLGSPGDVASMRHWRAPRGAGVGGGRLVFLQAVPRAAVGAFA